MIDFILFSLMCFAIFALVNAVQKQITVKTLEPIRIETEEELRKRKLLEKCKSKK